VRLGLTLLALAAFAPLWFRPEMHHEVQGSGGLVIDAVTSRVTYRYPDAIPLRVVVRNEGDEALTLTWPTTKRLQPECVSASAFPIPRQHDAVELWFRGDTIDADGTRHPYLWHSSIADAPSRIALAPDDERIVARSRFTPPVNVHRIEGTLCVRAYGFTLAAGSYETARR
jgi:hypothetical protein